MNCSAGRKRNLGREAWSETKHRKRLARDSPVRVLPRPFLPPRTHVSGLSGQPVCPHAQTLVLNYSVEECFCTGLRHGWRQPAHLPPNKTHTHRRGNFYKSTHRRGNFLQEALSDPRTLSSAGNPELALSRWCAAARPLCLSVLWKLPEL